MIKTLVSYLRREDLSLLLFSYGFNVRNAMHSRKYSDDTSTFFSGQIMCTYIVQMRSSMQQFKHIYKGGSCVVMDEVHKRQDLGFWESCRGWRKRQSWTRLFFSFLPNFWQYWIIWYLKVLGAFGRCCETLKNYQVWQKIKEKVFFNLSFTHYYLSDSV